MSRKFAIFIIFLLSFFSFCKSKQVKKPRPIEKIADNYWYDENTLQIISKFKKIYPAEEPITFKRKKSCENARKLMKSRAYRLYPELKKMDVQFKIYHTLYYKAGGCKLMIHVSRAGLKAKLLNESA